MRVLTRLCLALMLSLVIPSDLRAQDPFAVFHSQIIPILEKYCFPCHSHQGGHIEANLALDWKSGWEKGGTRGPAIVPGAPDESLLIQAVRHTHADLKMPDEKLPLDAIQLLEQWIRNGAHDDREIRPSGQDPLDWWSWKRLESPPIPNTKFDQRHPINPVDSFVQSRLQENGLYPTHRALPRELIRRLYFDLTGLPPSLETIQAFEADPSQDCYEQIVDELLASPRYGERWARHWMDTIHFADSHGYEHDVGRDHAWPYRDYLIKAFNDDTSWSDMIRQQLAVDHFQPNATHLIPALGFLGAGTFDLSTYSTGPVTFDYMDRDDMLTQTMAAFTSTTANCARCHTHKFDPITQEDYYALQSVFAGVLKGDIPYDSDLATARHRREWNQRLEASSRREPSLLADPIALQATEEWMSARKMEDVWHPLEWQTFVSTDGANLVVQPDGTILASGPTPATDTYTVSGSTKQKTVTALRLDVLPNDSLPMKGPGRCHNGNLHLSEISLFVFQDQPAESGKSSLRISHEVSLAHATADFNQEGWGIHRAIDRDPATAWGIYPEVGKPHYAVFELKQPLELHGNEQLVVVLRQLHGGSHLIGSFQISVSSAPARQVNATPYDVETVLRLMPETWSNNQRLVVISHALRTLAERELALLTKPDTVFAVGDVVNIPAGNGKYQKGTIPKPKDVHLMHRGDIDKPRQVVGPGALSAFPSLQARFPISLSDRESSRRAALADWIANRDNVLTWRSIVNRVWHYHFGRGLCDSPSDLGRMGGVPSHPELIDWLARWFRDDAEGSLKALHRLVVTSHTYQQSSHPATADLGVETDSENRWLWRQNRFRLDADGFRDFVLFHSGQIDLTMGGPAIQNFVQSPGPQSTPKLDYAAYDWTSKGAGRRSIYRYVWRGIADPLMSALDFPELGLLAPSRSMSTSPIQSLALYNNRFVLHHCQAAQAALTARSSSLDEQIAQLVWRVYGRPISEIEQTQFREHATKFGLSSLVRVIFNSNEFFYLD